MNLPPVFDRDSRMHQLDIDTQRQLLELKQEPLRPPRPCTPGESIYLRYWQEYITYDPGRLHAILLDTVDRHTQRAASVCASFMVWMGNSSGREFTETAHNLARRHAEDRTLGSYIGNETSFMMAWAAHNRRSYGTNGNVRTIEAMLCPKMHYETDDRQRVRYHWDLFDEITMRDIDAVECMVRWWAGEDAVNIRKGAIPETLAANRQKLAQLYRQPTN